MKKNYLKIGAVALGAVAALAFIKIALGLSVYLERDKKFAANNPICVQKGQDIDEYGNCVARSSENANALPAATDWAKIVELINSGGVTSILQTRDLDVQVKLADGSEYKAKQPNVGAVVDILKSCKLCDASKIKVVTE